MKISDLIERKKELGYTNEMISEKSGVPLSTVNKIFGGITEKPRYNTLQSIQCVLFPEQYTKKETALYKNIAENLALDWGDRVSEGYALDEYTGASSKEEVIRNYEEVISWKKAGEITVDDLENIPDGMFVELIDGVIYDRNTPTTKHQFIVTKLVSQLDVAIEGAKAKNKDCIVFTSPTSVRPDKKDRKNVLIPDILVVCDRKKFDDEDGEGVIYGAPDLVIEVLSPSTARYDMFVKFNKYWNMGVREYWIINIETEEIYVYNFEKGTAPKTYSFEDQIPLEISKGAITIDFKRISDRLKTYFG